MNESGNAWDATKVMQVFNSTDATAILSCPIAKNRNDILIWANHSSGLYSVRSAYHWLMRQQHNEAPPSPICLEVRYPTLHPAQVGRSQKMTLSKSTLMEPIALLMEQQQLGL
ncbi:hypothetical protein V6N13_084239 [Hibiscus sabdariffa]|uniref:Uncharacterized protein n=1 Tax=Hibiscus sabdariffa TaxID=183260 RepID=A0ABR2T0G4_9ROSI